MKKTYRVLLFDLDGTLIDTLPGIVDSSRCMLEQLGYPMLSQEELVRFAGPPIKDSMLQFYEIDEEAAVEAADVFRYHQMNGRLPGMFNAKVYDGIPVLLQELRGQDRLLGVATNKKQDHAAVCLEYFELASLFHCICGSDRRNTLRKADIVRRCLEQLGDVDRSEVLLIGDSVYDARGAALAGVDFVAVTYGFGFRTADDVAEYPCVAVADSVEALRQVLL